MPPEQKIAAGYEAEKTVSDNNSKEDVFVLSLKPLAKKLAGKWDEFGGTVRDICARVIKRHLHHGESLCDVEGTDFVVVLASANSQACLARALAITREVESYLLGSETEVRLALFKVGQDEEGNTVKTFVDGSSLLPSIIGASTIASIGNNEGDGEGANPVGNANLEAENSEYSKENRQDRRKKLVEGFRKLTGGRREYFFRPYWDVRHGVVSTWHCFPALVRGKGEIIGRGYSTLGRDPSLKDIVDLDLDTYEYALSILSDSLQNMFTFLLSVSVHFETLSTASSRAAYLELCEVVPEVLRKYIVFEINGLPEGIPKSRLMELVALLQHQGRGVFVRMGDPKKVDLGSYAEAGVHSVGVRFTGETDSTAGIKAVIPQIVDSVGKYGLQFYIMDVRTKDDAISLADAGVRYIGGDAIGEASSVPASMYKLSKTMIAG